MSDPTSSFVQLLTEHQTQLRGYILAALANHSDTQDVLQKTNLVLWKKASQFRSGAPFLPWAISVARLEILAFLRRSKQERIVFSPDMVEQMCDAAAGLVDRGNSRQNALRECLQKLPGEHTALIQRKYITNESIQQLSESTGRSIDGIKCLLLRIRRSLARCIERNIAAEEL